MITRLANIIADFFVEKSVIDLKEREIYVYGCEAIFSALVNLTIVIVSGLITHELFNIFIFYFVFLTMRKYCGGYHAKTHLKCNLIFTFNVIMVILFIKNISVVSTTFYIMAVVTSNILVFWLAPIENENKPLGNSEIEKYRKIAIILSFIFTVITVLLISFYKTVSIIIALALLSVSLAMLITRMMKEVEVNRNAD